MCTSRMCMRACKRERLTLGRYPRIVSTLPGKGFLKSAGDNLETALAYASSQAHANNSVWQSSSHYIPLTTQKQNFPHGFNGN